MTTEEELLALHSDYLTQAHRMQSAMAFILHRDSSSATPKHLRVGINSCLADCSALATLMMNKGLISKVEYYTAVRDGMRQEADRCVSLANELLPPGSLPVEFA